MKTSRQIKIKPSPDEEKYLDRYLDTAEAVFYNRYLVVYTRKFSKGRLSFPNLRKAIKYWNITEDSFPIALFDLKEKKLLKLNSFSVVEYSQRNALEDALDHLGYFAFWDPQKQYYG